jgi:hypothetical protein
MIKVEGRDDGKGRAGDEAEKKNKKRARGEGADNLDIIVMNIFVARQRVRARVPAGYRVAHRLVHV